MRLSGTRITQFCMFQHFTELKLHSCYDITSKIISLILIACRTVVESHCEEQLCLMMKMTEEHQ